ncbi:MAG: NERD domain-containing protein [Gammaproteobacteria bacterium]|nr:NERD domain-containing protein [Gammaproteobacteria bacterium]
MIESTAGWISWGGPLAAALALGLGWVAYRVVRDPGRRTRGALRRISPHLLSDVFVPDGVDGYVHVDHVLLASGGVVVLDVRRYPGVIFGAEGIDQWTQVLESGSYKFDNPLPELDWRVQIVQGLVGQVPVEGRLLFTAESRFPKGRPSRVVQLDSLAQDLGGMVTGRPVPPQWLEAWSALRDSVRRGAAPSAG